MAQWTSRKKFKRLRTSKELSDSPDRKPSTKLEMDIQDKEDSKRYKPGELLSCDNVGPVNNPKSFEGYIQISYGETRAPSAYSHTPTVRRPRTYTWGDSSKYASTTRSTVYGLRSSVRMTHDLQV